MKLSVITVSFNARDVIRQTLASVTGQTYSDLEYIVIDGGSTDGTQAVIGEYTARIARFVSEPDGGIYFGMNKGIAAATGDFVLFLNAGDRFADERVLEDVAAFIGAHPGADAVFGDSEQVLEYGSYRIKPAPDRLDRSMGISPTPTCHSSDKTSAANICLCIIIPTNPQPTARLPCPQAWSAWQATICTLS